MCKIVNLTVKKELEGNSYWDQTFLNEVLADLPDGDRTVVIIPGAYQADVIPEINARLAKYPKVCVFVTSDEENKFQVGLLKHPDMKVYSQYGYGGYMWPLGYAINTRQTLKEIGLLDKDLDWTFIGQNNHYRREKLALELSTLKGGYLQTTGGFSQGLDRKEYLTFLARAKAAPAPAGAVAVDSFRMYEALEAGCVPIADNLSPLKSASDNYWNALFGSIPFPTYVHHELVPGLIKEVVQSPDLNNQVFAWWINKKHQFKEQLRSDLGLPATDMAVIIPVSPIPSHPDTSIIEETIRTIRVHTDAPIFITIDGVREEQAHMTDAYREFIRQLLWKCNFEFKDVLPVLFNKHSHQSGMMKVVVKQITVPYLLYVEADTPLTPDCPIDFPKLKKAITDGETNLVRFHFEAFVPEPHRHLMIGEPENELQKTTQWSQRPHLASTNYYRNIMDTFFSEESNTFIEDRMHGICQSNPWEDHKLTIYHPQGNIKRSYHLDGRAGDEKFDKNLIY